MPKKAVTLFFVLAFIGAAIFVFFTFPRNKSQMPGSNNQRPFPSAPEPGPNGLPVPESQPHPNTPKVPPGPTLRVMAWASAPEAKMLSARADAFGNATGRHASLTIDADLATYRKDLQEAIASGTPPDVCLVAARDFTGLDPARDLADITPPDGTAPRSIAAFTVNGKIMAAPTEFSVVVLFYNPAQFDQAGIGYPGSHWNWDVLEADTRAIDSLHLKTADGRAIYPLELVPNFDFWNILCQQAGHAALDGDTWHLGDADTKESQMRGLNLVRELFQGLAIAAPLPEKNEATGRFFMQQRAALLIAPSDFAATLPATFPYGIAVLPRDLTPASLARVNGWAVTAKSTQTEAARDLANYLSARAVHAGCTSVQKPSDENLNAVVCYQSLEKALVPRIDPRSQHMSRIIDQQVFQIAHNADQTTDSAYKRIQTEYQNDPAMPALRNSVSLLPKPVPKAEVSTQLRGL